VKRDRWPLIIDDRTIVRGAGGVVYQLRAEHPEVLLIHRPRLNDWSFPKGRLDPGETSEACALREVLEETGYSCELSTELPTVRYMAPSGQPKEVRFWRMLPAFPPLAGQAGGTTFQPNAEVDKIEWMDARDAFTRLTHKTDRLLLKRFLHGY
jgi:8-oxo-dGTP diphosphatase